MGSVMNSIMARSASHSRILEMKAEDWLVQTFYELQGVMEAFDGSMLVSGILGIINIETGDVNYFNAEHLLESFTVTVKPLF